MGNDISVYVQSRLKGLIDEAKIYDKELRTLIENEQSSLKKIHDYKTQNSNSDFKEVSSDLLSYKMSSWNFSFLSDDNKRILEAIKELYQAVLFAGIEMEFSEEDTKFLSALVNDFHKNYKAVEGRLIKLPTEYDQVINKRLSETSEEELKKLFESISLNQSN